ncbi:MAG: glycosyltransferase family 1 protein, partial [Candidatus Riflebacteria bacterium]|nr:glycosyltransferase family 1 protein [Candidatus Riflebacteria bacterium]
MHIGIDASNIISGGGLTHLAELLKASDPIKHGFKQITLWSNSKTLSKIVERPWLKKSSDPWLEKGLLYRIAWQKQQLTQALIKKKCDVLFVLGGTYSGDFHPFVTMSQNLIPFESREMLRYGFSWQFIRNQLLRLSQTRTFRRADGVVFLTEYAQKSVMAVAKKIRGNTRIIPHGLDPSFFKAPREQMPLSSFSNDLPFSILYVSLVDLYKHQWHVVEAVAQLRKALFPVKLDLIGPAYPPALKMLEDVISAADPEGNFIKYHGAIPFCDIASHYQQTNLFVFASSCENLPNILLESMASGLPVASSNHGAMLEILGGAGLYFNPESPAQIADAIKAYMESPELRKDK